MSQKYLRSTLSKKKKSSSKTLEVTHGSGEVSHISARHLIGLEKPLSKIEFHKYDERFSFSRDDRNCLSMHRRLPNPPRVDFVTPSAVGCPFLGLQRPKKGPRRPDSPPAFWGAAKSVPASKSWILINNFDAATVWGSVWPRPKLTIISTDLTNAKSPGL